MSQFQFDISGSQIDGARDYQEDAFLITHLSAGTNDEAGSLLIVADGMGGHAAGNVASNMAVQSFNRHLSKQYPTEQLSEALYDGVIQANGAIQATVDETAALKGMGCTLVACVLVGERLHWVSVGDSHLYLFRDDLVTKKNADHSYGGFLDRMAEAGTPMEPEAGFSRNMLMSALTGEDIADIDCPEEPLILQDGDRLILSSDGLDTLSRAQITEICASSATAKGCVDGMLQAVTDAGAPRQDNTTVVVVDVVARATTEDAEIVLEDGGIDFELDADADTVPRAVELPAVEAAGRSPATAESDEDKGSSKKLIAALVGVVILIGVVVTWLVTQQASEPAAQFEAVPDLTTDDTALEEIAAVVPEPVSTDRSVTAEKTAEVAEEPSPPPAVAEEQTAPVAGAPFKDSLKSGGDGPLMVPIPPGDFTMGGRLPTDSPDEFPQRTVSVSGFAMSVFEISVAEFKRFAASAGVRLPRGLTAIGSGEDAFPATYISWNDALAYTKWLSKETGHEYRLPTEAQWEYAARGGVRSAYWWGREIGRNSAHCFTCDTGLDPRNATAVGRFKPNPFGLYDTAGNVQEWVYDCYHKNYEGAPTDGTVFEGGDCSVRVLRGGGFSSGPDKLRSAGRDKFRPDKGNDQTGIRVIRLR